LTQIDQPTLFAVEAADHPDDRESSPAFKAVRANGSRRISLILPKFYRWSRWPAPHWKLEAWSELLVSCATKRHGHAAHKRFILAARVAQMP